MGKPFIFCLALMCAMAAASAEKVRYDGYHIISVNIESEEQREFVERLDASSNDIQLLDGALLNRQAALVIPLQNVSDVGIMFSNIGLVPTIENNNFQRSLDEEQPEDIPSNFGWTAYHPLATINRWIDEKVEEFPQLLTSYDIGTTHENRTIRGLRLSHKQGNPTIFVESTVHAREWVTVATTTYLLNELLTSKNETIVNMARNYDWVIIPVLNVDGYEYTHTQNRMWRKNRKPSSEDPRCVGVDVNRNMNAGFGTVGSSGKPCSETYRGLSADSEAESQALDRFVSRFSKTRMYFSFHSFSQLLLTPYGYTTKSPPNLSDLLRIGQKGVDAIEQRFGTLYRLGPAGETIYPVSGNTVDWAYDKKKISLSYTFEFRPKRNTSHGGFTLPADQIIPNSQEAIDGIAAMLAEAEALNYF